MSEEQKKQPVTVVLKCQYTIAATDDTPASDAFGFDLTAECLVEQIPALVRKLHSIGVRAAQTPYTWDASKAAQNPPQMTPGAPQAVATHGQAPVCPVHGTVMAQSKFGGWYCKALVGTRPDGSKAYCQEQVGS